MFSICQRTILTCIGHSPEWGLAASLAFTSSACGYFTVTFTVFAVWPAAVSTTEMLPLPASYHGQPLLILQIAVTVGTVVWLAADQSGLVYSNGKPGAKMEIPAGS